MHEQRRWSWRTATGHHGLESLTRVWAQSSMAGSCVSEGRRVKGILYPLCLRVSHTGPKNAPREVLWLKAIVSSDDDGRFERGLALRWDTIVLVRAVAAPRATAAAPIECGELGEHLVARRWVNIRVLASFDGTAVKLLDVDHPCGGALEASRW